jgi:hypothetical protein
MPGVNVTRIANLAKDSNNRFHRSPSNQEASSRIAFYLSRNGEYSYAIPLSIASETLNPTTSLFRLSSLGSQRGLAPHVAAP